MCFRPAENVLCNSFVFLTIRNSLHQTFSTQLTKLGVLSLVDDTHPAAAKLLNIAVVRNGLADNDLNVFVRS
jgi:hypothetical protein